MIRASANVNSLELACCMLSLPPVICCTACPLSAYQISTLAKYNRTLHKLDTKRLEKNNSCPILYVEMLRAFEQSALEYCSTCFEEPFRFFALTGRQEMHPAPQSRFSLLSQVPRLADTTPSIFGIQQNACQTSAFTLHALAPSGIVNSWGKWDSQSMSNPLPQNRYVLSISNRRGRFLDQTRGAKSLNRRNNFDAPTPSTDFLGADNGVH